MYFVVILCDVLKFSIIAEKTEADYRAIGGVTYRSVGFGSVV